MAKAIVWGAMALTMIGAIIGGIHLMNKDSGRVVGIAVGPPNEQGEAEVHVLIAMLMKVEDTPLPKPNSMQPDWVPWLDTHFDLRDPSGKKVPFRKGGFKSELITEMQAGTAEFIAIATIQAGDAHTLDYTPVVGEPENYQIALDGNPLEFKRRNFDPNY